MAVTETLVPNSYSLPSLRSLHSPTLPTDTDITSLVGHAGIHLGSTVVTTGATSLVHPILRAASQEGHWCGVVGMPAFGVLAAAEAGVRTNRLLLVPNPQKKWADAAAALLDACAVVVVGVHEAFPITQARRLSARTKQRSRVLVVTGSHANKWPQSDARISCDSISWSGVDQGFGYLHQQQLSVSVSQKTHAPTQHQLVRYPLAS